MRRLKRWELCSLALLLLTWTAQAVDVATGTHTLIQDLEESRGLESVLVMRKISERYDPRFIWPIIEAVDRGMIAEGVGLARHDLVKYGRLAEMAMIEYLRQDRSVEGKLRMIDILAAMQSAMATEILVELSVRPGDDRIPKAVDGAMLSIGDLAAPDLARLVKDERLGDKARNYLQNIVTEDALRVEAEKRAGAIAEEDWARLKQGFPADMTNQLIAMIEEGEMGTSRPLNLVGDVTENAPAGSGRIWFVVRNLLMVLAVLVGLYLLWRLIRASRAIAVRGGGGRKLELVYGQVQSLIGEEKWDEALSLLGRSDASGFDLADAGSKKRVLKAQILLGRAREALAQDRFDQAEDDFEHYCHLSGESSEHYLEQIQKRRIEHELELAQSQYVAGSLNEALVTAEELLSLDYTYAPAHVLKALAALEEGRFEEAAEELRIANEYAEEPDPGTDILQAYALERAGDPEAALAILGSRSTVYSSPLAGLVFIRAASSARTNLEEAIEVAESLLVGDLPPATLHSPGSFLADLEERYAYRDRITAQDLLEFEGACHHYLGRLLQASGDRSGKAQRELARARELGFNG